MAPNRVQNVMVMGAGAVGGFFGGKLSSLPDINLSLVARGEHLAAIQKNGLHVKSIDGSFVVHAEASDRPSELPHPDLILFTVKTFDTEDAISQIRPVVSHETVILTLQNGLENRLILEEAFGKEQVVPGICRIGARISEPGLISHTDPASVIVGTNQQTAFDQTDMICSLFRRAEVKCRVADDITREIWKKFSWNAIFNMLTAAENCTVEALFEKGEPDPRMSRLADEIVKTAKAEGVDLRRNDLDKIINRSSDLGGFITSTLHDRREGKPLEYDAFTGALLRLGNKHGLELPEFRKLHRRLEALSKIGFFDL